VPPATGIRLPRPAEHESLRLVTGQRSHYRKELDGLRALAILPVILFHAGFKAFSGGFVGVDVFFVISGYLITAAILSEKSAGTFTLSRFYERRARRLLPALLLLLIVSIPLAWVSLLPADLKNFSLSLIAVTLFASNFLFWHWSGYFDSASELKPLLHTWSLGVEAQYYLLFPLFFLAVWRFGRRWTLVALSMLALASLLIAQWTSVDRPFFTFFLLPTRGFELLIGACVALHLAQDPTPGPQQSINPGGDSLDSIAKIRDEMIAGLGVILVVLPIFIFDHQTPFPSVYALVPTLGTAILIAFATQKVFVGRLLSSPPFVGIGLISYSAYLWHQPLFAFVRQRSTERPEPSSLAVLSAIVMGIAYFSWRFVEKPFRSEKTIPSAKICSWGLGGSLFLICLGALGFVSDGFPNRFATDDRSLASLDTIQMSRYTDRLFLAALDQPFDDSRRKKVLIVGDSFAKDLVNVINETEMVSGLQVSTHFISSDCGNLYLHQSFTAFIQSSTRVACERTGWYEHQRLKRQLNEADEIWLSSAWSPWVAALLPESIRNLKADFKKPVLIFGSKNLGQVTARTLLDLPVKARFDRSNFIRSDVVAVNHQMRATFSSEEFIDISALLCSSELTCRLFDPGGSLLSYDGAHLTPEGAKHLGAQLMKQPRFQSASVAN